MSEKTEPTRPCSEPPAERDAYAAPHLVRHGTVEDLTHGVPLFGTTDPASGV